MIRTCQRCFRLKLSDQLPEPSGGAAAAEPAVSAQNRTALVPAESARGRRVSAASVGGLNVAGMAHGIGRRAPG